MESLLGNFSYIMNWRDKAWVSLIGQSGYINYSSSLVSRQFGGIQQVLKTQGLAEYTGLFKDPYFLTELEVIKQD
jgi:hypothetical protein